MYFEYKVHAKIIGKPTFDKLHKMFRQLKGNAAAVPCTLGGGENGYLGMLVSAAQYNKVAPGAPFVPPPMPGALVIDPAYTKYKQPYVSIRYIF